MKTQIIEIENEAQWLAERAKDVTSTEISALYGLSPYSSEFELFHQKRDGQPVKIEPNERMKWGNRLESAIAHGAAEDQGWDIRKFNVYMRDPDARLGSSFDFQIDSKSDGPGILEIKNVDWVQYKKSWIDDGDGNIEAPEHIELQIQHQMEVSGHNWCALVALVGGNEQKIIYRNRDKSIGVDIRLKVAEFWKRVEENKAPSPDYATDAEFIIKKLRNHAEEGLVVQSNMDLDFLIEQYAFLSKAVADQEKLKDATKAQILELIGPASKVVSNFGTISCGMVKDSKGTLVTQSMVGTYVGGRKGYRNFRFTAKSK